MAITSRSLVVINPSPNRHSFLFWDVVFIYSPGQSLFFIWPRLTLNFRSSCLSLMNAGITSVYYRSSITHTHTLLLLEVSFFLILSSSFPSLCPAIILLHKPGWPHTPGKTPVSDSWVLTGLTFQPCATTPSLRPFLHPMSGVVSQSEI